MILPMKRVNLVYYVGDSDNIITELQQLGVVDIEQKSDKVDQSEGSLELDKITKILQELKRYKSTDSNTLNTNITPLEIVSNFETVREQLSELNQLKESIEKEMIIAEPWGDYSQKSFDKLLGAGLYISFFSAHKKVFESLDKSLVAEIINTRGNTVYFVVLSRTKNIEVHKALKVILPEKPYKSLRNDLAECERKLSNLKKELVKLSAHTHILEQRILELKDVVEYETVKKSVYLAVNEKILILRGWIPESVEKKVREKLDSLAVWYEISEPTQEDSVPVKMKNNWASSLFEPLTKIFALPDYFEIDPTPFFAPFYALFFGLCLGDLGYGTVMLIVAIILAKKSDEKLKPIFILGAILGLSTMLSGLALNTFFGHNIFTVGELPGFIDGEASKLAVLATLQTKSGTVFPAMSFSVYIGVVQILLATVLKGINKFNNSSKNWQYVMHPLASFIMICGVTIFLAKINFLDMGEFTLPALALGPYLSSLPSGIELKFIGLGLVILFLFNNPSKQIAIRLPLGLWELYNFVTGLMGDGLSYIRLFALGLAGGLLGGAFNQIAFMLISGESGVHYSSPLIVGTILILILGHTINFALAAIGSFVHPLRLTFVEFYNNLEFKGGARAYSPFVKRVNN